MKYALYLSLALASTGLAGCSMGPYVAGGAATMVMTSPSEPPPADLQSQIPQHETWCYRTLGDTQCFAHAQDLYPDTLVNVEPQNRYPLTMEAYRNAVSEGAFPTAQAAPTDLAPVAAPAPVEKAEPTPPLKKL